MPSAEHIFSQHSGSITSHNISSVTPRLEQQTKTPTEEMRLSSRALNYSCYNQTIYKHASRIYSALQHEPREDDSYMYAQKKAAFNSRKDKQLPYIDFSHEEERKLTYQLAFAALKYQFVLEDMLTDTAFYIKFPEFNELSSLVMVVLSDYLKRKFHKREFATEEIIHPEVVEVEDCIFGCKIKLDAALARRRIKENARAVEDLLPNSVKIKDKLGDKLLTFAWINFAKTSMDAVISELRGDGYQVLPETSREVTGIYFCLDNLFDDTLVFSCEECQRLNAHHLVKEGHIVIQDKTSLFGPQSALAMINAYEDIVHIDSSSGLTSAHLSSLMKQSKKTGSIYLFGVRNSAHRKEIEANLARLDANNVKVIDGTFDSIDPEDIRFKNTKIALLHAQCSKSAVMGPVGFVISEGEDLSLLKDLSIGKVNSSKLNEMARANLAAFRQAVKLPKIQAVVYVTRSVSESENERVVHKAIESYNASSHKKCPFRVIPPVFGFDKEMAEQRRNDKFYRHPPSEQANGCFIALVTREIEDVKESAVAVLQRAAVAGLITADQEAPAGGDNYKKAEGSIKVKKIKSSVSTKKRRKPSRKTKTAFGTTHTNGIKGNGDTG